MGAGVIGWTMASPSTHEYRTRYRRHLPHLQFPGRLVHVTAKVKDGNPLLATEAARDIVADALRSLHKEKYLLHAYVVMPNHFHATLLPLAKPERTMNLGGSGFPPTPSLPSEARKA